MHGNSPARAGKRHNLPFAVYVATDFADGRGDLWWLASERAIHRLNVLTAKIDGSERRLSCVTVRKKTRVSLPLLVAAPHR